MKKGVPKEFTMNLKLKNASKRVVVFVLLAAMLAGTALAGAGPKVYINNRQLANNLTYTDSVSWSSALGREESHVLALNGAGDVYPIISGKDTMYGGMTISEAIALAEKEGKNVLAAVNTDFFTMSSGVPTGIIIEDGVYKSSPGNKTSVCFSDGGAYIVGASSVTITLQNTGSAENSANAGKTTSLKHFNKSRTDTGGMYMYSSDFSTVSTRATSDGWYVRFRILEGTPSVSGTMQLEVAETADNVTSTEIGEGYLVLTAATQGGWGGELAKFAVGDQVTLTTTCTSPRVAEARWATGGGDLLISEGSVTSSGDWDKALLAAHPRTAIGVKADGTVITYVIDGRQNTISTGLTMGDLADELLSLGCVTAVNLDGGGSSAMSIRFPGKSTCTLVNSPSDGKERKCGAYMLFVTDNTSDGYVHNLALANEGVTVLAKSSVQLSYVATDGGFRPVSAPTDITASSGGLGTIDANGLYTAGTTAGMDSIMLSSYSAAASGSGEIHVITDPTSLTVYRSGTSTALTEITVRPGDVITLSPKATYYYRAVTSQVASYTFAATGDIGTVDEAGVFTAAQNSGAAGTITVSAGSKTATINVKVSGFTDVEGHWAREYIDELAAAGVISGVTSTTYAPESNIKRGDFVLMLYCAAGEPAVSELGSFEDVLPEDYYAAAVAWAKECGITTGMGDGTFSPQTPLTREQAFAFVYRAFPQLGITAPETPDSDLSEFSDASAVSEYAVTPTAALVGMGIVNGDKGEIKPAGNLTRAQMAKILCVTLRGAASQQPAES